MSLTIQYDKQGKIYSPLREKYFVATPEEQVRQKFVCTLVNVYGYDLAQMDEEVKVKDGKGSTRADIVIWKTIQDKQNKKPPLIIVECKADTIRISEADYEQGESYARIVNAPFFVTHNSYETRFWRVKKDKMPGYIQEIASIPKNNDSDKDIQKMLDSLVVFKEDEFANLLHKCHNVIRNIEKLDPAAAFDEISKILFMKVYVERELLSGEKENKFTLDYIEQARKFNPDDYLYDIFKKTKKIFAKDLIFSKDEKINLKEHTILRIIKELQIYNLSLTSTDVKGIAFERFLGRTFRGEIGQFFTPRSVVDFMVEMIEPLENEVICDPASGSGGFLIRVFNKVRESIQKDIIKQYEEFKFKLIGDKNDEQITQKEAQELNDKFQALQKDLQVDSVDSRLYKLSNHCIFGTDANDRMARTSKMNMIMHGDGHSGIHHHDGLLNVNGIFENRFDVILTNPPFGAQVEKEDKVQDKDTQFEIQNDGKVKKNDKEEWVAKDKNEEIIQRYYDIYGKETYQQAQLKIIENIGKPIASLFTLKENSISDKTEHLFINRSLDLLKPSGRMGIVLPEGVFNTPNAQYVRKFVEGRAFLRAVVSLPSETFLSSKASVKCSILFLQKFSEVEQTKWDNLLKTHKKTLEQSYQNELDSLNAIISYRKERGEKQAKFSTEDKKHAKKELKELIERIEKEALSKTKIDFDYPIFMAEPEFVGITSTGETGDNVPNELLDSDFEILDSKKVPKNKGIATHFKEFLQTHNIAWHSLQKITQG